MYNRPERKTNFEDVGEFHTKFGLDAVNSDNIGPRDLPDNLIEFRLGFILEELKELIEAMGWKMIDGVIYKPEDAEPIDHAKAFDSLLDLNYVSHGLAHLLGYPWQAGWNMVQQANMTKERAERADQSERGGTWDVIKPPGWKPPDIEGLLYTWGWDIPGYNHPTHNPTDEEDAK